LIDAAELPARGQARVFKRYAFRNEFVGEQLDVRAHLVMESRITSAGRNRSAIRDSHARMAYSCRSANTR
jgi:hypothetical protein